MSKQNSHHCREQAAQEPIQLALNVAVEEDSCAANAPQRESVVSQGDKEPSIESREYALLRDAQAHWRAVDRLTRNLRKRSRASQRPAASRLVKRTNAQTSVQKTLWVSVESNDGSDSDSGSSSSSDSEQSHQLLSDNSTARHNTMVSSDPGLEICRHLVAALRLQHEQDQLRQANFDEKQSA